MDDLRYHTCTVDDPWSEATGKRGIHPDAIEGEQTESDFGGDIVRWHCPTCGVRWKQELPE
jgi:hypothetical protein